ncbi:MAG: hypothetical protein ACXWXQ_10375 [Actinomycetota bacterium]
MTIDERLRQSLRADLDPSRTNATDVQAGRVLERARRRRAVRRTGLVALAVTVVAVVAIAIPQLVDRGAVRPADRPAVERSTTPALPGVPSPLIGTFGITVLREPRAATIGAVGRWVLAIDANRIASLGRAGETAPGTSAFVAPASITIRALPCGKGPGHYAWGRSGSEVRFSVVDDPCPLRRYVLSGAGVHWWHEVGGKT